MRIAVINFNDSTRAIAEIRGKQTTGKPFTVEILDGIRAIRTPKQNNAVHVYCGLLAEKLNHHGLYMNHELFRRALECEWSKTSVKEYIWKSTQRKMLPGKDSTTELTRKEVSAIYDPLNNYFSNEAGIYVPFPKKEAV